MLTPTQTAEKVTMVLGGEVPEDFKRAIKQYLLAEELKECGYDTTAIVDASEHPLVLLPLRLTCAFLPKMDPYGELQEMHNYVLLDMDEKIDTGRYGSFRFVG